MIVKYPERGEKTMTKDMSAPTGTGNEFPKNQESIQRYERGSEQEHPDEAMPTQSPASPGGAMKLEPSVKEYPRGKED